MLVIPGPSTESTHLKRILDRKLSLGSLGGGLNLGRGVDLDLIRSVRHPEQKT